MKCIHNISRKDSLSKVALIKDVAIHTVGNSADYLIYKLNSLILFF